MIVAETDRLRLRWLVASKDADADTDADADADFILELVNEPAWLEYIGDRKVHDREDARRYIADGPATMVRKLGFALHLVERRSDGARLGICGLLKRDSLDDVDLGFALLARHTGHGYAREAAAATLADGHGRLGLARILAITTPHNAASIRVLLAIGFHHERTLPATATTAPLELFASERPVAAAPPPHGSPTERG